MADTLNRCYVGTMLKFDIHVDPITGKKKSDEPFEAEEGMTYDEESNTITTHMAALDFKAVFSAGSKSVTITKEEMTKEDDDNYIAVVDTEELGPGTLICKLVAYVPDDEVPDGDRREVIKAGTGIVLVAV